MGTMMRAVDVKDGHGPVSSLFISDSIPKPQAKPSECLIKVKAFGINRADTSQRKAQYPVPPGVTQILGLEFSGVVEEVGSDTSVADGEDYKIGEEVFGLAYGGAYAEYIAVSKKMLLRKPKELSWEECAGVPEVWMTALQAIHLLGEYSPSKVKSILWHAGASSVSIAGIQLSRKLASPPIKVYATTRQDSKCRFVTETLGADAAFNTTKTYAKADGSGEGTWVDEVKRVNGEGVDLVIDFVGGPYFTQNLDAAARDGRIILLGAMGGTVLSEGVNIAPLLMKRLTVIGSTLRSRDLDYQKKLRDLFAAAVLPKLVSGEYETSVDTVLSWHKIQDAHQMIEGNQTMGKIVCVID